MNDREIIEELRERIRQLEEELAGDTDSFPTEWKLSGQQRAIMATLMRHDTATKERLHFSLYGHRIDQPGIKIIDVLICKLRKRLEPTGITIGTIWGKGYFISPEDKEHIQFGPAVPRFLAPKSNQAQQPNL